MTPEEPATREAPLPGGRSSPSDDEVVRRVLAGETALFELLMRRNNPKVYRAVRGILRNEAECEDAMQQAYLHAFASLKDFNGTSSFSTWLVRIAINEALGRLRKDAHLAIVAEVPDRSEDAMTPPQESPENHAASREAMHLLERAIDRLPLIYRTVFVLREVEQLSTGETARALELTEEAVKVRLHRARLALRDLVVEDLGRAAPEAFPFLAPRCDRVVGAVMQAIGARAG